MPVSFSLILHDVFGDKILISGSGADQFGKTDDVVVVVTRQARWGRCRIVSMTVTPEVVVFVVVVVQENRRKGSTVEAINAGTIIVVVLLSR